MHSLPVQHYNIKLQILGKKLKIKYSCAIISY